MHKKMVLALGTFLLTVGFSAAQETITLNIKSSVDRALEHNKNFLVTAMETDSIKKNYDRRWNALIPSITASGGLEYRDYAISEITNENIISPTSPITFNAGLSLSLPLNTGLINKMDQTRIDYEAKLITYETAQKQLVRDVEKEFYYLLAIQSNLEILEMNLELAEKRFFQTQANYNNGFASELQVLQAQVSAANYKPELSQALSDYDNRQRSFLILLGMDPEQKVKLEGELFSEDFKAHVPDMIRLYLESRQDIRSMLKQIESLTNNKKSSISSGFTPTLSLTGGWNTAVNDPFEDNSWLPDIWTDSANVGVSLRIPLDGYIPGSTQQTTVSQNQERIDQAGFTLSAVMDSAKTEILNLNQSIETSKEKLKLAELNIILARRSYEMTEESFQQGGMERLDVEDAQQSYLSAKQQKLSSQYQYLAGLIDLKYALNLDSMQDLYELNIEGDK